MDCWEPLSSSSWQKCLVNEFVHVTSHPTRPFVVYFSTLNLKTFVRPASCTTTVTDLPTDSFRRCWDAAKLRASVTAPATGSMVWRDVKDVATGAGLAGCQLLPSCRSCGNIEAEEFLGGSGEAHILRVGLRPGSDADHFTALVKDRAATVAWRNRTRHLILAEAIHCPNLTDQSIADAEIIAFGCANHISAGGYRLQFPTHDCLPTRQ